MRGHRSLFVLASLGALGLIGFANFPGDRDSVTDGQAALLVGGGCANYLQRYCGGANCNANYIQATPACSGASADPTKKTYCGGSDNTCSAAITGCNDG